MVLGSNRRKHWVSGRAVYAPRTNGNCSVIMRGVGRWGDMMRRVIKQGRVGGRCDSGRIFLAEHPSYLPHKDFCLRKQTGGRQRRRGAYLNSEICECAHRIAALQTAEAFSIYGCVSSVCTVSCACSYCVRLCVCSCMNACAIVQSQHSLLTARAATAGCRSDT